MNEYVVKRKACVKNRKCGSFSSNSPNGTRIRTTECPGWCVVCSRHIVGYLGGDSSRGDVGGAMLVVMVVVVVVVPPPPPVLLLLLVIILALGATLHSVCVGVGVGVHVGQQRGWRGQLLQGGVRRLDPDRGLTQQVDGVWQSRQNELETLLQETPASNLGAFLTRLAAKKQRFLLLYCFRKYGTDETIKYL